MKIQALQVGSIGTNCYILCDEAAKVCAVIDPGAEPELILSAAEKLDCTVDKIRGRWKIGPIIGFCYLFGG